MSAPAKPTNAIPGGYLACPGQLVPGGSLAIRDTLIHQPGVLRHWGLDGNSGSGSATAAAETVGGNNATYNGTVGFGANNGPNGENTLQIPVDYLTYAGDATTIDLTNGATFYCWHNCASPEAFAVIMLLRGDLGKADIPLWFNQTSIDGGTTAPCPAMVIRANPGGSAQDTSTLTANTWHEFIVIWAPGGASILLYIDRVLVATGLNQATASDTGKIQIGGGVGDYKSSVGYLSNAAVFGSTAVPGLGLVSPPVGWNSSFVPPAPIPATCHARVTEQPVEVLRNAMPLARVTELAVETLRSGNYFGRVTEFAVEVLRSTSNGLFVSATNNFTVTATATISALGHSISVGAASSFTITPTAAEFVGHTYNVSAASSLTLTPHATEFIPVVWHLSAANSFTIAGSGNALVHHPTIYNVSAASSFTLKTANVLSIPRIYLVSASNHIMMWGTGSEYVSPIHLSASSAFVMSATATGLSIGAKLVSATTSMIVASVGSMRDRAILRLSAANSFVISGVSSETRNAAMAATTSFVVSAKGKQNRNIAVSAISSFSATAAPTHNNFLGLAGTNSLTLSTLASAAKAGIQAQNSIVFVTLAQAVVQIPWRRNSLTLGPGGNLPHS